MYKHSLQKYLDDLAANLPAPGGGSAAALTAATGVALISMVANFTVGKEKYRSAEAKMKEILSSAQGLRDRLTALVDEDVAAYKKFSSAYKLPKDSAEEKVKRREAIQRGLKEALSPPFEICKYCHEAIKLCAPLVEKGNPNLITDTGIAAILFNSAFQSALLNVEINLKGIKDEKFVSEIREILEPMEKEIALISQEVVASVERHLRK